VSRLLSKKACTPACFSVLRVRCCRNSATHSKISPRETKTYVCKQYRLLACCWGACTVPRYAMLRASYEPSRQTRPIRNKRLH
jgi:hypothetical protein